MTIERELEEAFSQYDHEGNGFISAEHLPSVMNALPQFRLPVIEELRSQLDPEGTSMLIWDRCDSTAHGRRRHTHSLRHLRKAL